MVVLDVAVVNVALPSIRSDLHFSVESLQWVLSAYAIFFGGFLLLGGRLADVFGRRRLFMTGLVLFAGASLACGLSWNEASLITFRCIQGLGGALLSPAALSILVTTFAEGRERNLALGIWGGIAGSGAAAGTLLGGVLTSAFGWQWIFFVNVPIGAVLIGLSPFLLPASRVERRAARLRRARRRHRHGRPHDARLRPDPGHPDRLGRRRDDHPAGGRGRAADRLHRDRAARAPLPAADAHPRPGDAARRQHRRLPDRRRAVLAVLPAVALHAAGAGLLGPEDRRRLHRDHLPGRGLRRRGPVARQPLSARASCCPSASRSGGRGRAALHAAAGERQLRRPTCCPASCSPASAWGWPSCPTRSPP